MANDITTLAIQIQSQEAERSLQTFNALMLASSQAAAKISNIAVNVDVSAAMAQIQALKSAAAGIKNLNIDSGIAVPTGAIAPAGITPDINVEALNELKNFFATTNAMSKQLREEIKLFDDSVKKLETTTVKVNTTGGRTVQVSKEYAAALREVVAAQKEMEQAIARADADGQAVIEADNRAAAIKQQLLSVQRELQKVTAALSDTHRTYSGNIMELAQQEEALKNKVDELSAAYRNAQEEADKLGKKLDKSAYQADNARDKYQKAQETLNATPKKTKTGKWSGMFEGFDVAELAGKRVTNLARGINGIGMMTGVRIPGLAGLGQTISMIGTLGVAIGGVGAAIAGAVAGYKLWDKMLQESLAISKNVADGQERLTKMLREESEARQTSMARLAELNSYERLSNSEKEESCALVRELAGHYKNLSFQYDETTGKVNNLTQAMAAARKEELRVLMFDSLRDYESAKTVSEQTFREGKRNSDAWVTDSLGYIYKSEIEGGNGYSGTYLDRMWDYVSRGESEEDKIKRIGEVRKDFLNFNEYESWQLNLSKAGEEFTKYEEALTKQMEKRKTYEEYQERFNNPLGMTKEEQNRNTKALEEQLEAAKYAALSPQEKHAADVAKVDNLKTKLMEYRKAYAEDPNAVVDYVDGKQMRAEDAMIKAETEILTRTRELNNYQNSVTAAQESAKNMQNGYSWDNYGNIVRKKDEDELAIERQNEIAAVRARIAATEAGTQERYEAEEELRRLQIEEYNYQSSQQQMADSGLPAMQNEQRLSSTMIQGIEARSQESFALQARTFQRPENALNNMSESERRETEIRDCVIGYEQYLKNISDGSIALNDAITRL